MRDELVRLLEPAVVTLGYELVELEFAPAGSGGVLRLFIDAAPGITLGDCERVSRQVSAVLESEDPIPGHYTLEVSSPGLDRVLRTRAHFERFLGSRVKVQLGAPLAGRRRFTGTLLEVRDEGIVVDVDGARTLLEFGQIQKARLVPVL
ncbi:MAG TPA: ribosome maturation factor RimP [Steroidobacteraceae bacterium]|nr:ribosome maturation factor RimP [Steroidobacteraceae bacterium]